MPATSFVLMNPGVQHDHRMFGWVAAMATVQDASAALESPYAIRSLFGCESRPVLTTSSISSADGGGYSDVRIFLCLRVVAPEPT